MIIIIPIGGIGQRFKDNGYTKPKALINLFGRPLITYLLDNLNIKNIDYIFIPYNKEYKEYRFEDILRKEYSNINFKFYCIDNNTRGAAETINIGLNSLNEKRDIPVICLDSDNFYTSDIITKWNGENCVFSFKDYNNKPIYSYVKTNDNNNIIDIKEKEKISDNACTGAYGFKSIIHPYNIYAATEISNMQNNRSNEIGEFNSSLSTFGNFSAQTVTFSLSAGIKL
jgi:dTDP-glucose pyrophosphorylase